MFLRYIYDVYLIFCVYILCTMTTVRACLSPVCLVQLPRFKSYSFIHSFIYVFSCIALLHHRYWTHKVINCVCANRASRSVSWRRDVGAARGATRAGSNVQELSDTAVQAAQDGAALRPVGVGESRLRGEGSSLTTQLSLVELAASDSLSDNLGCFYLEP